MPIPIILYVIFISLILVTLAALFGDRTFTIATFAVCLVNLLLFSPLTLAFLIDPDGAGDAFLAFTIVVYAAPIVAIMLHATGAIVLGKGAGSMAVGADKYRTLSLGIVIGALVVVGAQLAIGPLNRPLQENGLPEVQENGPPQENEEASYKEDQDKLCHGEVVIVAPPAPAWSPIEELPYCSWVPRWRKGKINAQFGDKKLMGKTVENLFSENGKLIFLNRMAKFQSAETYPIEIHFELFIAHSKRAEWERLHKND